MTRKRLFGYRSRGTVRVILLGALLLVTNVIEGQIGSRVMTALAAGLGMAGLPALSWAGRRISISPFSVVTAVVVGGTVYVAGWVALLPLIPVWFVADSWLTSKHARKVAAGGGSPEEQLQRAIETGDTRRAMALVEDGANIRARVCGDTALGWAVLWGNKEVAEYLLSRGADIRQRTGEGDLLRTARWAKEEASGIEGAQRYDVMIEFLSSEFSSRRLTGQRRCVREPGKRGSCQRI